MEENSLLSVIVPVYNVEQYLSKCLNSLITQSHKNLEILIIDDCGTDNSMDIANIYAKNDSRIKIIKHKKNKGVSAARNTGIDNSNGEFLFFLDSDDFISVDYLKELVQNIGSADVVQIGKYVEYFSDTNQRKQVVSSLDNEFILDNNAKNNVAPSLWNKLYRKKLIAENSIRFPEGVRLGEDMCFNYFTFPFIELFKFIPGKSFYYYVQRETSAVKNKNIKIDILPTIRTIYGYLKEKNVINRFSIPISHFRNNLKMSNNKKVFFNEIKNFFENVKNDICNNRKLYLKKELIFFDCVLSSKSYYMFNIKFFLKRIGAIK